jgi:Uncharacterized conserved protein (DUF2358)
MPIFSFKLQHSQIMCNQHQPSAAHVFDVDGYTILSLCLSVPICKESKKNTIMMKASSSSSFQLFLLAASIAPLLGCAAFSGTTSSNNRQPQSTARTISSPSHTWHKGNNNTNVNKMAVRAADLEDSSSLSSLYHQQRQQQQQHPSSSDHNLHISASATSASTATATATIETSSGAASVQHSLSAWETYLQDMYRQAVSIKCPFFRRRASDLLDAMDQVFRFLVVVRHKSLELELDLDPLLLDLDVLAPSPSPTAVPSWRSDAATTANKNNEKLMHLSMHERLDIIRRDWRVDTDQGYYITARLNTSLYRDDCTFDGPDPDMPVRGLQKYINAASQLFDVKSSRAQLLQLQTKTIMKNAKEDDETVIVAYWKIHGTLRLPWKPKLPTWTGSTTYHFDADTGLIYKHVETWDISVLQAFVQTLAPNLARRIWKQQDEEQ